MNVEIGTVAMQYFSRNIFLEFSVLFLCSVDVEGRTEKVGRRVQKGAGRYP
jgi:hypothetical protein